MLDFRRHHRKASYLGSAEQRRLLVLVGLSTLVLVLISKAGNPTHWRWIAWDAPNEPRAESSKVRSDVVALPAERDSNEVPPIEPAEEPSGHEQPEPATTGGERMFPGVRRDYLEAVRDDTVFRAAESAAWFHLFEILAHIDESRLSQASEGRVGYLQLDQQPAAYRGRLVTVGGVVRGCKQIAAAVNDYGIQQYYQLWLQPDRSSESLMVVYCLQLPQDFPVEMQIAEEATVTGFFYKRWAYQSQGGITTAPLLLARTVDWHAPPVAGTPLTTETSVEGFILASAAALGLAMVTVGFLFWRGRSRSNRASLKGRNSPRDKHIAATLASLEHADVGPLSILPPTDPTSDR